MIVDAFTHSFSTDQQVKIMQQIQSINKRLSNNSYSIKAHVIHNQIKSANNQDFNYFSEQCQQLFKDEDSCDNNLRSKQQYDHSLFYTQNEMLLENNQYEKQIRNFEQFQTSKINSQNNEKQNTLSRNTVQLFKIFQSQKSKDLDLLSRKQSSFKLKQKVTKNNSQSGISKNDNDQQKIKMIVESKIKKYIQNKQNILPAANRQKQKSFIKQVSKKIRSEVQPIHYLQSQQIKDEDSLQFLNNQDSQKEMNNFNQNYLNKGSRSRNKYDSSKNNLQCTFKPSILKRSHLIAQTLQPSFERLNIAPSKSQSKLPYKAKQQLSTKKYSVKRMEQLSQPRRLKTTVEPQDEQRQNNLKFRPSLSKKSLEQMANCSLDVVERNKLWLEQRQVKINRMKVEEQVQKIKKQTGSYAPKINEYKGESEVHLSRFAKQGISSYFERVSMTKQKNSTYEKKKPEIKQQMTQKTMKIRKKTYDQAVKQLHKKIMNMNI